MMRAISVLLSIVVVQGSMPSKARSWNTGGTSAAISSRFCSNALTLENLSTRFPRVSFAALFAALMSYSAPLGSVKDAAMIIHPSLKVGAHSSTIHVANGWGVGDVFQEMIRIKSTLTPEAAKAIDNLLEKGWYSPGGAIEYLTQRIQQFSGHEVLQAGEHLSIYQILGQSLTPPDNGGMFANHLYQAASAVIPVANPYAWVLDPQIWNGGAIGLFLLAGISHQVYRHWRKKSGAPHSVDPLATTGPISSVNASFDIAVAGPDQPFPDFMVHSEAGQKRVGWSFFRRWQNQDRVDSWSLGDHRKIVLVQDGNSSMSTNAFVEMFSRGGQLATKTVVREFHRIIRVMSAQITKSPASISSDLIRYFSSYVKIAMDDAQSAIDRRFWRTALDPTHGTTSMPLLVLPEGVLAMKYGTETVFGIEKSGDGEFIVRDVWPSKLHPSPGLEYNLPLTHPSEAKIPWGKNFVGIFICTDGFDLGGLRGEGFSSLHDLWAELKSRTQKQWDDATVVYVARPQIQADEEKAALELISLNEAVGPSVQGQNLQRGHLLTLIDRRAVSSDSLNAKLNECIAAAIIVIREFESLLDHKLGGPNFVAAEELHRVRKLASAAFLGTTLCLPIGSSHEVVPVLKLMLEALQYPDPSHAFKAKGDRIRIPDLYQEAFRSNRYVRNVLSGA